MKKRENIPPRVLIVNLSARLRAFYAALEVVEAENKLFKELYPHERKIVRDLMKKHQLTKGEAIERFLQQHGH